MKKKIFVIVGMSGAGKDYNINLFNQKHNNILTKIISSTTRNKRPGEVNGINYYFRTPEFFNDPKNNFVEKTCVDYGDKQIYYGIETDSIKKTLKTTNNAYLIVDPNGHNKIINLFKNNPNIEILTLFLAIDKQTQADRIVNRDCNITLKELQNRINQNQWFADYFLKHKNDPNTLYIDNQDSYQTFESFIQTNIAKNYNLK